MKGRGILLVVLIYFSIDLSVPEIPGAFVFEADDSVEVSMTTASFETIHMPTLPRASFVVPPATVEGSDRPAVSRQEVRPSPPVRPQLPRASLRSAPSFEDPH